MNGQYEPIRDLREVPPRGFEATRRGTCAVCHQAIDVGAPIRRVPGLPRNRRGYAHEACRG